MHWDGTRWLRWNGSQWTDATTGAPIDSEASQPVAAGVPSVTSPVPGPLKKKRMAA